MSDLLCKVKFTYICSISQGVAVVLDIFLQWCIILYISVFHLFKRVLFPQKVCDEISATENNIADLKKAIKDKEDPMKVAQTRLHVRENRPNVELCRDPVQYKCVKIIFPPPQK